jgi:hypothetical protein
VEVTEAEWGYSLPIKGFPSQPHTLTAISFPAAEFPLESQSPQTIFIHCSRKNQNREHLLFSRIFSELIRYLRTYTEGKYPFKNIKVYELGAWLKQ